MVTVEKITPNGQVLPMAGYLKNVRRDLLPIEKLNLKVRIKSQIGIGQPELLYNRIPNADCFNVQPRYWQYPCCVMCYYQSYYFNFAHLIHA
jgi:hypothetical protein